MTLCDCRIIKIKIFFQKVNINLLQHTLHTLSYSVETLKRCMYCQRDIIGYLHKTKNALKMPHKFVVIKLKDLIEDYPQGGVDYE